MQSFEVSRFGIVDGAAPERDALDNIPKPAEVYLPPAYEGTIPAGAIHVARSVPVVLANSSSSISTENTTTTSPRTFSPSPTIEQLSSPPPPSSHPFKRFVQRLLRKSHNGQEKKRELDRAAVLDLLALQNTYAPEWFGPTQRQRRGDIEAGRAEGEENIVTSLPPYSEVGLPPTGRTVPEYMFFCGFLFPLLWIIGAVYYRSRMDVRSYPTLCAIDVRYREKAMRLVREQEKRWAVRCIAALAMACFVAAVVVEVVTFKR